MHTRDGYWASVTDTIGYGEFTECQATGGWHRFSFPVEYNVASPPADLDTLRVDVFQFQQL